MMNQVLKLIDLVSRDEVVYAFKMRPIEDAGYYLLDCYVSAYEECRNLSGVDLIKYEMIRRGLGGHI